MKAIVHALQLGMTVVFMIVSGTGLGYLCDQWLGLTPLGIVAGVMIGTVMAFVYLYQITRV